MAAPDDSGPGRAGMVTGVPGKTGVVYTLDRETGEFLWATPTVTQNVISAIDGATGAVTENAEVVFTAEGQEVFACPTWHGGKDWEAGAYSPRTNMMYMPLRNTCASMMATRTFREDTPVGRNEARSPFYAIAYRHQLTPGTEFAGTVRAISAETGRTAWLHEQRAGTMSLVATGGGLVFGGDVNGRFRAFDDETGEVLWGDQPRLGGHRLPDQLRGRRPAVHRGRHRLFGNVGDLHRAGPGAAPQPRQQPVRVRVALKPHGFPQGSPRSSTRRASGPTVFQPVMAAGARGTCPSVETRPAVGFNPTTPQNADGTRMLPAMSAPSPSGAPPAAMIAPSQPELPPADRSRRHGFRVRPLIGLAVSIEPLMSEQLDLPNTMAPAAFRRRTASASRSATFSRRRSE